MADNPNVEFVSKYFPIQGSNLFETYSSVVVEGYRLDLSTATTAAATQAFGTLPGNCILMGFYGIVRSDLAGTGVLTIDIANLTAALGAAASQGTVFGDTEASAVRQNLADLEATVTVADMTQGVVDIYVAYIPMPRGPLSSAGHSSFTLV